MTSEAEICARFAEAAREDGWEVYPEVSGWDLLLVWTGEPEDYQERRRRLRGRSIFEDLRVGDQLAIEAKRRANVKALDQCIKRLGLDSPTGRGRTKGPDFASVLAPTVTRSYKRVCKHLGIKTFEERHYTDVITKHGITKERSRITAFNTHRLDFEEKLWMPPIKPSGTGGESSPSPLTSWRIGALKLCWILRERGWVTKQDFDAVGVNKSRWVDARWIVRDGSTRLENPNNGREYDYAKYVLGRADASDFPDHGWEDERDRLVEADPKGIPEEVFEGGDLWRMNPKSGRRDESAGKIWSKHSNPAASTAKV